MNYGIHWFRRDLRVAGNLALRNQVKEMDGKVLGLFCFDKDFLGRDDFSSNRFQFFLSTLKELKKELQELGSDLLVLDIGPFKAFPDLLGQLKDHGLDLPKVISWNRDYEPFAKDRDEEAKELFRQWDIEVQTERDHLLIEPHELEKNTGGGYQVYSPFARKWLEIFQSDEVQARLKIQKKGLAYLQKRLNGKSDKIFDLSWKKVFGGKIEYPDHLSEYFKSNEKNVTVPIPEAGSLKAYEKLKQYATEVSKYKDKRDIPAEKATSRFSMYLKNGSLSVPQIIAEYSLKPYKDKKSGEDTFFSELIWREFYFHVLERFPRVEGESFNSKYKNLKWENNKKWFEKWKDGKTGFPIVDAGMRELKQNGFMHNRVRMIVASFLTKDLLIDWRWGEKYFMEQLLDGDLSANNGGWQWAASTGCDPQPYFRIFNPWSQSKKFDPDGKYIFKYVKELSGLKPEKLHSPIEDHDEYPAPIVDHKEQREKALKLYKNPSGQ